LADNNYPEVVVIDRDEIVGAQQRMLDMLWQAFNAYYLLKQVVLGDTGGLPKLKPIT
jgi:hypothetical protein